MPIPAALPVVPSSVSSFILSFPCPSVSVLFSVRLETVPHSLSGTQAFFIFLPLFGPAFLPFAHASSFLKTPGVPLSQSHIPPAKVSFCTARCLSFAAEAVLLGPCLSNREIFSRNQSLSLAPGILPLILPEFFPPNEEDCSRAVYIILCRQDCPPAHTVMVMPTRLGLPRFGNTPFFPLHASIRSPRQTSLAHPARGIVPCPSMFPCAGRIAFLHILP